MGPITVASQEAGPTVALGSRCPAKEVGCNSRLPTTCPISSLLFMLRKTLPHPSPRLQGSWVASVSFLTVASLPPPWDLALHERRKSAGCEGLHVSQTHGPCVQREREGTCDSSPQSLKRIV